MQSINVGLDPWHNIEDNEDYNTDNSEYMSSSDDERPKATFGAGTSDNAGARMSREQLAKVNYTGVKRLGGDDATKMTEYYTRFAADPTEHMTELQQAFATADADGDGVLSEAEWPTLMNHYLDKHRAMGVPQYDAPDAATRSYPVFNSANPAREGISLDEYKTAGLKIMMACQAEIQARKAAAAQ